MNENISICVMSKEFSLDIFFKQAWNDPRLVHELEKPILLSGSEKGNFWLPDTFFLNIKTAKFHHVPAANSRIAINPNGDVELSERYGVDDFYCYYIQWISHKKKTNSKKKLKNVCIE